MGIPRLTQDVAPYAETIVLGKSVPKTSLQSLDKLVIDGPSLVYHVYNALLRVSYSDGITTSIELPSYVEINQCLEHFLQDLTSRGVTIQKIIFDGALPLTKRSTRLERLEKTRQDLEHYRKFYTSDNSQRQLTGSISTGQFTTADMNDALWNSHATTLAQKRLLPPPPFMVASAIEYLQSCPWANITHIVCGEADGSCAFEAAMSGSAVLSNDSDLLLYELGEHGSVIVLRTLDLTSQTSGNRQSSIRGDCLRPNEIAKRLSVPSMLSFGYQRLRDSSASTNVISQRAREQISIDDDPRWTKFREEYRSLNLAPLDHSPSTKCPHCSIVGLDPRVAELICSFKGSEMPHLYLPITLEDPVRDASWTYGYSIRRLAFSLLLRYHNNACDRRRCEHVVEFARKGQLITNYQVTTTSSVDLLRKVKDLSLTIAYYLDEQTLRALPAGSIATATDMLQYHLLAASFVVTERVNRSKSYEPSMSRIFVRHRSSSLKDSSLSWDDVHFYASMQSVLYSLRILKQIMGHINHEYSQHQNDELWNAAQPIYDSIKDMPRIETLFPSVVAFRRLMSFYPLDSLMRKIRQLLLQVDPENVPMLDKVAQGIDLQQKTQTLTGEETHTYVEVKSPRKRRKQGESQITSRNHRRPDPKSCRDQREGSANAFALLASENSR